MDFNAASGFNSSQNSVKISFCQRYVTEKELQEENIFNNHESAAEKISFLWGILFLDFYTQTPV